MLEGQYNRGVERGEFRVLLTFLGTLKAEVDLGMRLADLKVIIHKDHTVLLCFFAVKTVHRN